MKIKNIKITESIKFSINEIFKEKSNQWIFQIWKIKDIERKKIRELNKIKNEIDRNLESIIYKNVNKASLKVFKKINGFKL